jgi:hypothetical protein
MYSTCLFCSADLGTNEAIESFPVGRRIAFDAWKGRLWAVCSRCGRWNLAPLEERWEAVETADRLFTDTRARVQSEHIGLCRLRDGTRLVRVGKALPGELAAWRYGGEFISRRRRNISMGAAVLAGTGAVAAGVPLLVSAGLPLAALNIGVHVAVRWRMRVEQQRVVHRIAAGDSPTGEDVVIRRIHMHDAVLTQAGGGVGVELPEAVLTRTGGSTRVTPGGDVPRILVTGEPARRLLARAMTDYNRRGAKREHVQAALDSIERMGGVHAFEQYAATYGAVLARPQLGGRRARNSYSLRQVVGTFRGEILPVEKYRSPFADDARPRLSRTDALALEMVLNEEAERRALEGELAALEAAWREAEEIAHIADALPGEPWPETAHGTTETSAGAGGPSVALPSRGGGRTGLSPPSPGPRVESGSASSRRRA